jgi:uncharacterized protein (DUF1778 family)
MATQMKDARMELRVAREHKDMIEKAAALRGSSTAQFMLSAALQEARKVLAEVPPEAMPLAQQTALLSEAALRRLWDTPEEDEAWRHL